MALTRRMLEDIQAGAAPVQSEAPRADRGTSTVHTLAFWGRWMTTLSAALGQDVVQRFADETIYGAYILYNEFKSVIA